MDISDGMDKPWDHPWTTDEMRKKRREWSLAGDAGLLKHLQQFSDNLLARANKTEEALDSLTTQLNETAIFIDNVTNTSLALANTQFIESRVEEDHIEIEKKETTAEESKDHDSSAADFIASVSESVKQGLNIMYQKYKEMEFEDSDSEEEDNKVVLSVVLGPNNPYQDRPLPYVIGSEKWKNSSKIGLGSSSSSESEQVDEEEETESEDDATAAFKDFSMDAASKKNPAELLSTMNEPDYNKRNDVTYIGSDKLDVISQNNMDSILESVTPNDNVSKVPLPSNVTPNFAEELAKRLGTVRQTQRPAAVDEKDEASINRFKDDLFAAEEDEIVASDSSRGTFGGNTGFLADQASDSLWKEKPIKSYKNNIIPASIDIPPPISAISTKPKSAIDDLFADADSEDSNDIFSPKTAVKTITRNNHSNNSNQSANTENAQKKYLDVAAPAVASNMATSTPETNANATSLFSDDEDVGDLFGASKNPPPSKKKPVGGVSILGKILTSDVESKLSSRMLRSQSSGSSGSNTPANNESSIRNEPVHGQSGSTILNGNISGRDSFVAARNNAENLAVANESSNSSGIMSHPPSINNTGGSSLGVDFQPQMTSTRLKSEEIYRERVVSDSLFTARTRDPVNATSNSTSTNNPPPEESIEDVSSIRQDDVFENDDLFGPPPLPKADSRPAKSKVSSLFDDSDSGDELFSRTSSGSRSQKSSDFLSTTSHSDKPKFAMQRRGLFDEEIDIFGNKDTPDVDIFGVAAKPQLGAIKADANSAGQFMGPPEDDLFASDACDTVARNRGSEKARGTETSKNVRLFGDEDVDDGDLFAPKPVAADSGGESRISDAGDGNDLFAANGKRKADLSGSIAAEIDAIDRKVSTGINERKGSDILSGNGLFSTTIGSHGLLFEDDDYDDLFEAKSTGATREAERAKAETKEDNAKAEKLVRQDTPDPGVFAATEQPIPIAAAAASDKVQIDEGKEVKGIDPEEGVRAEKVENEPKKSPPRSLDIPVPLPPSEETVQGAKRAVSGKIKNLMGKMADLKILSPMDTPPLWRKSEERTDEEDSTADRDSNDGGCISTHGHSSPPSISEDSCTQKQSQQSAISDGSNAECAISFDEPAQVETLSTIASKTRVRIQAKRRPQSRRARKSAIRQNGIDFDTVDTSGNNSQDERQVDRSPSIFGKETRAMGNADSLANVAASSDRLVSSSSDTVHRGSEGGNLLAADDKSEIGSISKESSMSANKNTLLSPSTDEEDLFDVPPDLPEDPQREDTLFGRAPILSPVERLATERAPATLKPFKDARIKRTDDSVADPEGIAQKFEKGGISSEPDAGFNPKPSRPSKTESNAEEGEVKNGSVSEDVIDPLRDSSHDPLKDPSQLFAFVTKTPSPEKGKNLLFAEDDSLFSSGQKKVSDERGGKKSVLDLFADDADGDLFSTSLAKPVKIGFKDTKTSLFDEDDEDDSLFGSSARKTTIKGEGEKKQSGQQAAKKGSLFDDDDNDTSLFFESSEPGQKVESASVQEQSNRNEIFASITEPVRTSHITDIFADQSSGEEDIFGPKPLAKKPVAATKSLFPSDDDDNDDNIFGKRSTNESRINVVETRSAIKKPVTRDLKKTAEKIGEDPLSVLLDD